MKLAHVVALALLMTAQGCAWLAPPDRFGARPISFSDLGGWQEDDHALALATFLKSCDLLASAPRPASEGSGLSLSASLWQSLCLDARKARPSQARAFFERRFTPFRVNNNGRETGLFTGYYEPVLYGATKRYGDFLYPLYAAPQELAANKPYYTHAEINAGALEGRKLELVWVDDPVMRFFLQIQGSGRIKLASGKTLFVGYADQNGHAYRAIGKIMAQEGMLPRDQINFFTIRQWLYTHPDRAFALMERNPSYVFFKIRSEPGAIGAAGVALTPGRSLAVDSRFIPYGLPLFLETDLPAQPQQEKTRFERLMIAQDTGGAIRSPVRGDIFFGAGDEAEYFAGYMSERGVYTLLVPHEIVGKIARDVD